MRNKNTKQVILTGVRATGALTIANYIGAVKPIIELQEQGLNPYLFIADLHAATDHEPRDVKKYVQELIVDYLALGIDPEKTTVFVQSSIKEQISLLTIYLSRLTTVAELLRVPTLKEKVKHGARLESANALLFLYPVMMAADILIQRSTAVPVGEDQVVHLEVAKTLAKRFNKKYGEVFPEPKVQQIKSFRVLSLKGDGKMSKSSPEGAIFLTDSPEQAEKKIKRAQTGMAGEMTASLGSLILIAKELDSNEEEKVKIDQLVEKHLAGESVMGEFKSLLAEIAKRFLTRFQEKRNQVLKNKGYIKEVVTKGNAFASQNADETILLVEKIMYK